MGKVASKRTPPAGGEQSSPSWRQAPGRAVKRDSGFLGPLLESFRREQLVTDRIGGEHQLTYAEFASGS